MNAEGRTRLNQLPEWHALGQAPRGARRHPPAGAVRAPTPERGDRLHPAGRRPSPRLLQAPGHRRDAAAAARARRGDRRGRAAGRDVPRREDQRHRGPRRAAHRAARPRDARRSRSTARTSCPACTRCSTRWPTSPTGSAPASGPATPASASRTSSTSASAAPTSAPRWPTRCCAPYTDRDLTVRFVSNVDGADLHEAVRDLDPAETLFIIASKTFTTIETITNATSARALAARRELRRRPGGRGQALRGGVDQRREGRRVRHRHGQHVRVLGLGRRPLLLRLGHRPVADDRDRPGRLPARCSPASTSSTSTSAPRPPRPTRRCCWACWASGTATSTTPSRTRCCPTATTCRKFTAYLQQLDMESNGKSVDRDGKPGRLADRARRVGHARHQRPARLLPAASTRAPS